MTRAEAEEALNSIKVLQLYKINPDTESIMYNLKSTRFFCRLAPWDQKIVWYEKKKRTRGHFYDCSFEKILDLAERGAISEDAGAELLFHLDVFTGSFND